MRVTVLGCGTSGGVPSVAKGWGACDPTEPRNARARAAILVEQGDTRVLVDTPPELRLQLTALGINRIDAVLWTHAHADHMAGIDDLRGINRATQRPLEVFADRPTLGRLREAFDYTLERLDAARGFYKPSLLAHEISAPLRIGELPVTPFVQDHGYSPSLGFRFGAFAYSTDVVRLDDAAFAALEGVDTWLVDCVRVDPPHPTHAHLPITLDWIDRVKPRRAILTHMDESMDYRRLIAMLPDGVEPAHDGMVIELPDPE